MYCNSTGTSWQGYCFNSIIEGKLIKKKKTRENLWLRLYCTVALFKFVRKKPQLEPKCESLERSFIACKNHMPVEKNLNHLKHKLILILLLMVSTSKLTPFISLFSFYSKCYGLIVSYSIFFVQGLIKIKS